MRILITGGGDVGRLTAETLANAGHEIVLIESVRDRCERLAEELDMMVICGDATRPEILEKAGIDEAELVVALSGNDQVNLITAIVAQEYGVKRIIVNLDDPAFNIVCQKLGVEEIVNPKNATASHIAEMARKPHALEVSTIVGGDIRVFTSVVRKDGPAGKKIADAGLPQGALAVAVQRDSEFFIPNGAFRLKEGDHVTVLAEEKRLKELERLFA